MSLCADAMSAQAPPRGQQRVSAPLELLGKVTANCLPRGLWQNTKWLGSLSYPAVPKSELKKIQFWNCVVLTKTFQEKHKRSGLSFPRLTICSVCHDFLCHFPSIIHTHTHMNFSDFFSHSDLYIHSFVYKFLLLHWPVCSMLQIQHLVL